MSINVNYYGAESTWINFPLFSTMTDTFKTGQYSMIEDSTYGLSTRTWLGCKYGYDINTYYEPLDKTFCWCKTDGNAPFDNTLAVTGFRSGTTFHYERKAANNISANSIGLCIHGNSTPYLLNDKVRYYKASSTGSTTLSDTPLNFKPPYDFAPRVVTNSNGLKVLYCANTSYSPALKFDFGNYYLVPFIKYYVLTSTATKTDWSNVTNVSDYRSLVQTTKTDDLRTFVERINNNTYDFNKIIISGIYAIVNHVTWNNDDTYDNVTRGTQSNTTGIISPFRIHDNPYKLVFSDWYNDTAEADEYTVDIDTTFVDNSCVSIGSCGIYNGKTNSISAATLTNQTAILLSGTQTATGTGYTRPTEYCYMLQPIYSDFEKCALNIYDVNFRDLPAFLRTDLFSNVNELREYVRKSCAYFGMFFSESYYPNATREWLNSDCFIGTIDGNGVTHGDYTQGTDNANQQQRTWGDEWASKTPYDPYKPPPTDENDKGDLTTHLHSGYYETSAIYYATTDTQIRKFIDFMNTYSPSDADLISDFKGVNPADYITNCLYFPFNVMYSGANSPIYLSVLNTTATGLKFSSTYGITYVDFGSIYIERYFNDFRDFSPYTKLSVDIPFSSTVDLDISEFYNHYLTIKMCIDFTTGDTITLIFRDDLVVKTVTGNCAVQLPISALSMATYQDTINSLQTNAKIIEEQKTANDASTLINTGVGIAAGVVTDGLSTTMLNPATTVIGGATQRDILIEQGKRNEYSLSHATPSPVKISGGTPNSMMMLEYIPRYTITRCKTLNNINFDVFGKTTGYATVQQGIVSDFSGLIVCADVEFNSISATSTEQDMIKNILKSGVIV